MPVCGGLSTMNLPCQESNASIEVEQQTFRTILVAVADPSSREQPVVDRAVQMAKATGARLVLFHAAFDSSLSGRPFFDSARLARSRGALVAKRLQALERRASALAAVDLSVDAIACWEEPAHEAVVRAALREKADLVVAGRHEPRADSSPPYRLTDWELMRMCPRPLLVVHPSGVSAEGSVLAALDPTHAHDKPASLDVSIVRHAVAIADALGVDCHAMHSMSSRSYPFGASAETRKRFDARMRSRIEKITRTARAEPSGIRILRGDVAESLPKYAKRHRVQIVVMGIISRRWMKRFVIGDTAERVVRSAPCDLLLIKPERFRLRLGRTRKESIVLPAPRQRRGTV